MGLGYKDFAPGAVLTAAEVDGYLMRQTLMKFASSAARDSALSGVLDESMHSYQTDTDEITYYNGSAWKTIYKKPTSWSPTWTGLSVGNGVVAATYTRQGDAVTAHVLLTLGTTSSVSGSVSTSLPVATTSGQVHHGSCVFNDVGTRIYVGVVRQSSTSITIYSTENNGLLASTQPFTWTTNDELGFSITYSVE